MGEVNIRIGGDNTERFEEMLGKAIDVYFTEAGLHLEGEAKKALEASPRRIDTGLLRNSITFALAGKPANKQTYHASYGSNYNKKGKRIRSSAKSAGSVNIGRYSGTAPDAGYDNHAVYIGTNVEYAEYVHDGTSKMDPNRFLTNAVQWNKGQLERKAVTVIRREMKGML